MNRYVASTAILSFLFLLAVDSSVAERQGALPRVVTAGADQTVRVWDSAGRESQNILAHDATVTALALSQDGRRLYSASTDRTIKVWTLEDGAREATYESRDQSITCMALSPDGRILATGAMEHSVKLWNAATGQVIKRIPAHSRPVQALAWSPDGSRLASAGADRLVQLWKPDGSQAGTIVSQEDAVAGVVWTSDGRIITGGGEGNLKVWSGADMSLVAKTRGHERGITGLALSPDGSRIATAGADGRLKVWSVGGKALMETASTAVSRPLTCLTWNASGAWIVAGGEDRALRYFQASDLTEKKRVNAHDAALTAVLALGD